MSSKLDMLVLGKRAGLTGTVSQNKASMIHDASGFELSEIVYKPINFFIENPINVVFEKLKDEAYFERLKKDIDETRAILNPLITMKDGMIIEGHSRLLVAKQLEEEGKELGRLPVRIILSALNEDEMKRRVYLGNLSRFEISEDAKILMYAEIWPDYFQSSVKPGKKSDHGETISVKELSAVIGKSAPQIKRDKAIYRDTVKRVQKPTAEDIRQSRKTLNEKRKRKTKGVSFNDKVENLIQKINSEAASMISTKSGNRDDTEHAHYSAGVSDLLVLVKNEYEQFRVQ